MKKAIFRGTSLEDIKSFPETARKQRTHRGIEIMSTQQVFDSVWDALEDDPVERANMKLRSSLMRAVRDWFDNSNLTQTEAAAQLKVSRSNLSSLLNGHIHLFTIDRLVNMLEAAGKHVELKVAA